MDIKSDSPKKKNIPKESYKEDRRPAQQWYWGDWFSAFDVRLCSLEARGLWIDMLGIMFQSEIRGTLTISRKKVNSKTLAKIVGDTENKIAKLLQKLEAKNVFSRLGDGTIICRRMYRESVRKEEISEARSKAGKEGAKKRWQEDSKDKNKKIAKIAASTSSSTSSSTSKSKKEEIIKKKEVKIDFNFEKRKFLNINVEDKAGWLDAYPAVDIEAQLRIMREWLLANPSRKKSNYRQFINNWLKREQDKGGSRKTGQSFYISKRDRDAKEIKDLVNNFKEKEKK